MDWEVKFVYSGPDTPVSMFATMGEASNMHAAIESAAEIVRDEMPADLDSLTVTIMPFRRHVRQ